MIASLILRFDFKGAVKIFKRDRFAHLSPNSAQTEAVAAGALQIQLGGTHNYFGKAVVKPTIGDDIRPVAVSYTHLDVYKRQIIQCRIFCIVAI